MEQKDAAAAASAGTVHVLSDTTSPDLKPLMSPSSALLSMLLLEDDGDDFLLDSTASSNQNIPDNCVVSQSLLHSTATQTVSAPSATENGAAPPVLLQPSLVVNIALKPAKVAPKRRRTKDELDTLREDVEELQQELQDLNAAMACGRRDIECGDNDFKKAKMSRLDSPATKLVLKKNRKLRQLINEQMRFTKKLDKMLGASLVEVPSRFAFPTESNPAPAHITDADLVWYYEALAGKLDLLYTQLSDVFAAFPITIDEKNREAKHTLVVQYDTNAMTVRLYDHKIMPFDFQSVCDVLWQRFRDEAVSGSEHGDDVVLPIEDDVTLIKKTMTMESPGGQGHRETKIPVRLVTKRFVSKNCMVLCSKGTTTWPRGTVGGIDGLQMHEKSWIVVKPMPNSGSMRMCVVEWCTQMSPSGGAGVMLALPGQMSKLETSVIPKYQQISNRYLRLLENSLLDKQVISARVAR